jgi:hypothetical protein
MEETVKKFIENNKLTFEVGSRNSDATILCGFINYLNEVENVSDLYSLKISILYPCIIYYVNNIDNTFASNILSQAHYIRDNVLSTDVMDYYLLLDKEQVVLGAPYFNTKGDLLGLGHVVANEPVLIPVEYLRQAVRHLLDNTQRVVWGISYLDLENNSGILSSGNIVNLPPAKNSLAAKAGLLAGDRITAVNNDTVSKDRSLTSILQNYRSGDKVVLKVLRSGVEMDIDVEKIASSFSGGGHPGAASFSVSMARFEELMFPSRASNTFYLKLEAAVRNFQHVLSHASRDDLERQVCVTPKQIAAAGRWFRLDVSEEEIRAAVEDVPGLAELFDGGRLRARR